MRKSALKVPAVKVGTRKGETRATFIVDEKQLECIKAFAYCDRKLIKDIVAEAVNLYLTSKGTVGVQRALRIYSRDR